jgi:hypothetical protein
MLNVLTLLLYIFSGFCSLVPGFSNFVKGDQEKLAMNAYMEIWMVGTCRTPVSHVN